MVGGRLFGESHLDDFIGPWYRRTGLAEARIIPAKRRGLHPLRLPAPARLLHHDAPPRAAGVIRGVAPHPHPRPGHRRDGRDAPRPAAPPYPHLRPPRPRIAV